MDVFDNPASIVLLPSPLGKEKTGREVIEHV